ncbi:Histone-lysine N-methyltransferase, H3 lysine-79 specific [Trichoplax sp. H2]|nr:Histone-lysine N-methyltransferase, H3 lysine-79 specific [Trichoplax sp. H2]|eukprot:RDD47822.1 Histone-lysine N-methyltransferase, H3 lysine-79 specific [Trichoplax sp. H2]
MGSHLKLHSPAGTQPIIMDWPLVMTKHRNQAQEIIDTISFVCEDFVELRPAMNNNIAQFYKPESYESMSTMCEKYNRAIDGIRQLWKGRQPPKCLGARPSSRLLEHIIHIVYSIAVPNPEKLNNYEPFSPEAIQPCLTNVYGETSFSLMTQILKILNPTPDDVFIDLGSGVGQAVLQAAASTNCKECWGIEKADIPAKFAKEIDKSFRKWMKWFGKSFCKYQLVKGDFLAPEYEGLIPKCTLIFVNNFAFGPAVDHQLKQIFANLVEGAKIVSSREFMPLNFRISSRNLSDIGSMMRIEELASLRGGVSWTGKPVKYYLHTVDSTALAKYFDRGSDQTSENNQTENLSSNGAKSTLSNFIDDEGVDDVTVFESGNANISFNSIKTSRTCENRQEKSQKSLLHIQKIPVLNERNSEISKIKKRKKQHSQFSIMDAKLKAGVASTDNDSEYNNLNEKVIKKLKKHQGIKLKKKEKKIKSNSIKEALTSTADAEELINNQKNRKTIKAKISSKLGKSKKRQKNATEGSVTKNEQLLYNSSGIQNVHSDNVATLSKDVQYSGNHGAMPRSLLNKITHVNKHHHQALAGYDQILTSIAQNVTLPEFQQQLKHEHDSLLQQESELTKYLKWLKSENRSLLDTNARLADKALKELGISNPADIGSWYPKERTAVTSQYSKDTEVVSVLKDELTNLHQDNIKKFNEIKAIVGPNVGEISTFEPFKINQLLSITKDSTNLPFNINREGREKKISTSSDLSCTQKTNHSVIVNGTSSPRSEVQVDYEVNNLHPEESQTIQKMKMSDYPDPNTFKANVNTNLLDNCEQLGVKSEPFDSKQQEKASVNDSELKLQSGYRNHCYDVKIANGINVSNGTTELDSNHYNECTELKTQHKSVLMNHKTPVGNNGITENGFTTVKSCID